MIIQSHLRDGTIAQTMFKANGGSTVGAMLKVIAKLLLYSHQLHFKQIDT